MGNQPTRVARNVTGVKRPPTREEIDKAMTEKRLVSLILLGSGESGKSTILRQMILLHGEGFTEDYKNRMKPFILFNVIEGAEAVLHSMQVKGRSVDPEHEVAAGIIKDAYNSQSKEKKGILDQSIADAVLTLLKNDKNFQLTVEDKDSHLLQDGWPAMAANLEKFPVWGGEYWAPGNEDILSSRVRTTGINNHYFKVDRFIYRMVDVGGQRAERKKYLDIFKDMNGVLFVGSLGEYNLQMFESPEESRLVDSLLLWKSVTTSATFANSALLLFLNKFDILQQKYMNDKILLPRIEDFRDPPNARDEESDKCTLAVTWFEDLYLDQVPESRKKSVYCHLTTAVDTKIMAQVINDVSHHIVTTVLGNAGMLPL